MIKISIEDDSLRDQKSLFVIFADGATQQDIISGIDRMVYNWTMRKWIEAQEN